MEQGLGSLFIISYRVSRFFNKANLEQYLFNLPYWARGWVPG